MIVITRGQNNTLILTLTENTTLSSPYYLVRAEHIANRKIKRFLLASNLSMETKRYDQFMLTESATEVLTSGTVTLSPIGMWKYSIYEQTSSSNLDETVATVTTPIEEGLFKVIETTEEDSYNYYDSQDKEYKTP